MWTTEKDHRTLVQRNIFTGLPDTTDATTHKMSDYTAFAARRVSPCRSRVFSGGEGGLVQLNYENHV